MANTPASWGVSNANLLEDSVDADTASTDTSHAKETTPERTAKTTQPGSKLLGAVSTLLALTPRGRTDELVRLTALAHGYVPLASDDELVQLAKAISNRDDVETGLADRLAIANKRAAQLLVRANRLSEEAIASLLDGGDDELRELIARHHGLHAKHIEILSATGSGAVLRALLNNTHIDFSAEAERQIEEQVAHLAVEEALDIVADPNHPAADPRVAARDFEKLDAAGRRAIMHRLVDDQPQAISMADARRALDPTRHDGDLAFLTVIEQRDPRALASLFAQTLNLEPTMVARLIDEADGDALLVMAKASDLSSTAFARMLILGKTGLSGSPRDTFDLVDRFNELPKATATTIIDAMRSGSQQIRKEQPVSSERRTLEAPQTPAQSASKPKARSITTLANQGFRRAV